MADISSKPYLIRALHEWCTDAGLTPYLSVKTNGSTRVPMEYVKDGEIILNISHAATRSLTISNTLIQFSARFNAVSREVSVPIDAVSGIFARENGQGMFFNVEASAEKTAVRGSGPSGQIGGPAPKPPAGGKARLKVVK